MRRFPRIRLYLLFLLALAAASPVLLAGCSRTRVLTVRPAAPAGSVPKLVPGAAGHIVIGPYVQPGGPDLSSAIQIVWWSDAQGPGALEWTDADRRAGGRIASEQVPYRGLVRHTARVNRPRGAKAVEVLPSVTVGGKRFTTNAVTVPFPPSPGEALRFAAVGDTGAGTPAERNIVSQVRKQSPNLMLITGDDVYGSGNWDEYRTHFFPYYAPLMRTVPILPVLGNHDVGNPAHRGEPFHFAWTPPAGWQPPAGAGPYSLDRRRSNKSQGPVPAGTVAGRNYSVDAGRCHFLALDSTADRQTIAQQIVPWATRDLADAKRRGQTWLIAFWHHPPYTRGAYRDNRLQWGDVRDLYVPMLREAGARLVLLGHDHNYQHLRKDGIDYVITGGGGARLYPVHPEYSGNGQPEDLAYNDRVHSFTLVDQSADGKTLSVRQIDETGKEIDRFTITAR